jgi:hypothetical protein
MPKLVVSDKLGSWGTIGKRFMPGIWSTEDDDVIESAKRASFGVSVVDAEGPDVAFPVAGPLPASDLLTKADFSRITQGAITASDGMEFASTYALKKYQELLGEDAPVPTVDTGGHQLPGDAAYAIRVGYHDEASRAALNQRILESGGLVTPETVESIKNMRVAPGESSDAKVPTPEEARQLIDQAREAPTTEPEVVASRLSTSAATPTPPTIQQAAQTSPSEYEESTLPQEPTVPPGDSTPA